MPASEQHTAAERYRVSPRTAIFVRRGEEYLLIKGSAGKRLWPGKYNAIGGHVEPGEDVLAAALRELREETGLVADLWLCGTVMVDAGETGVALFVFVADDPTGEPNDSAEGSVEWLTVRSLDGRPMVEDLPMLLHRIGLAKRGDPPFSAKSYYDSRGHLQITFA